MFSRPDGRSVAQLQELDATIPSKTSKKGKHPHFWSNVHTLLKGWKAALSLRSVEALLER